MTTEQQARKPVTIADWNEREDRVPACALVAGVNLLVIRPDEVAAPLRPHHLEA